MKYRSDFVTNSSSSSYIVAYNTPTDMLKALKSFANKHAKEEEIEAYQAVIFDVLTHKITFTDALKEVEVISKHDAEIKYQVLPEKVKAYGGIEAWENSREYRMMCKSYVDKQIQEFRKRVNPRGYIAMVTYTDYDGSFRIARNLDEMLEGIVYTIHIG